MSTSIYYSTDGETWEFYAASDRQDEIDEAIAQIQRKYTGAKIRLKQEYA